MFKIFKNSAYEHAKPDKRRRDLPASKLSFKGFIPCTAAVFVAFTDAKRVDAGMTLAQMLTYTYLGAVFSDSSGGSYTGIQLVV